MNTHLLLANDLVHALENQLDILLSDKEIALAKENSQNEVILNLQDGMLKMRVENARLIKMQKEYEEIVDDLLKKSEIVRMIEYTRKIF